MGRHHVMKPPHLYTSYPSHSLVSFNSLKSSYNYPTALLRDSSITALGVGDRIPGFKTSAAFLSSLHSNIFIELDSAYDSSDEVPPILQNTITRLQASSLAQTMSSLSSSEFAPPEALRVPESATDETTETVAGEPTLAEDGLPILRSFPADDDSARAEALHIVADTIAQQRNIAARAVLFHPITFAVLALAVAILYKQFYAGDKWDWLKIGTTMMGVFMAVLGGIRMACGPYIFEAERVGTWAWLEDGRDAKTAEKTGYTALGDHDEILLTKFGAEYIGAIIFRGVQPTSAASGNKKTRRSSSPSKHTRMVIRAWCVAQKYRRKEVGSALLEDALGVGHRKGWTIDGVTFDDKHANSKRVLPAMFNGPMDKSEELARKVLGKKVEAMKGALEKGRKRSSRT